MRYRDNELQIVTIDEELKKEKDIESVTHDDFQEIFERFYEIEINRLEEDYKELKQTIH
ncbi:MAG: hypothetical protein ABII18_11905 [bacterium]|nr:hypothetical protein [bacterium]MBU1917885.1 hypothetical protein [bacterium]